MQSSINQSFARFFIDEIFRFELVEPVGLDENQLKDIPYENIK